MSNLQVPLNLLNYLEFLPRESIGILFVQALNGVEDELGSAWRATFAHETPVWLRRDENMEVNTWFRVTFTLRPSSRNGWELCVLSFELLPPPEQVFDTSSGSRLHEE